MDQYKNFKVEDFVWDTFFRQWILSPTRESDLAWNQWLTENPETSALVRQAREVVLSLHVKEPRLSDEEIRLAVQNTLAIARKRRIEETDEDRPKRIYRSIWFQVAASVAILLVAGWWLQSHRGQSLADRPGNSTIDQPLFAGTELIEKVNKTDVPLRIQLADNSAITLTPGSSLRYPETFPGAKREVYLEGEAFFDIAKDPDHPFLVYANELVTKVLGTSFIIKAYERSREVTVEVKTGRVSVFAKSDPDLQAKITRRELEGVILSPNQKIIFERDQIRMVKTLVENPEIIVPKSQIPHFEFEDTPASEAFASIGKAYGIDILFDEELLSGCPLTARLDNQPLHEKLSIICKAVEASYEVLDGQIIIHSRGCRN
ncbi:FecR family protein [Dyadobacter psychrotolerans]|uniref:FecR family protein n=1 Tax=Dyadobacter psychrotolerans TaxID=2541721 RepID=A0A4R5DH58_9BACT|nr:FecR family protein [Dyadobacter psychrotolerans]TDE13356.1 FecR family protein [Dyadobacter psychrotolerans]